MICSGLMRPAWWCGTSWAGWWSSSRCCWSPRFVRCRGGRGVSGLRRRLPAPAAALRGDAFRVTDLGTVTGCPLVDLAAAVQEATDAGILTESGARLTFRHALIRQALHEQTPAGVRLALHRQAARTLAEAGASA